MKFSLDNMKAATELTKSGKLMEATALIQKLLSQDATPSDNSPFKPWEQVRLPSKAKKQPSENSGEMLNTKGESDEVTRRSGQSRFETRNYSCALGQRSYKLFTPSGYKGELLPLVIMLHGCTQSPDDFAAGTQMNVVGEELGFFVAYPAQSSSANSMGCWNWFKPSDQQKDRGEPALIAGITRELLQDYAVDARRVYVAGLSAGGAMAAVLGLNYPELFAAIGVHSGLPCGAATDVVSALGVMKSGASRVTAGKPGRPVPTIVFHGDRDRTVNPANADNVLDQFDWAESAERYEKTSEKSAGGMTYSKSVHSDGNGLTLSEKWLIHGAGHAWSGGSSQGSYTEPKGPDASREMIRFFFQHRLGN